MNWIKVGDRLPPEGKKVVFWAIHYTNVDKPKWLDDTLGFQKGEYDPKYKQWFTDEEYHYDYECTISFIYSPDEVTHWLEIEPPEDV
jgi:hypothetical protein